MGKATRLTAEQRSDLVAYLDGELDEAETRAIEETLAGSPAARRDIEILSRTWDLLDLLPTVEPSEDFTQKTISRLRAVESSKEQATARWGVWGRRCLLVIAWGGGLVGATLAGIYAAALSLPNEGQRVIRDFPVVEELDLYRSVGDAEFLEELRRHNMFEEEVEPGDQ